MKKYLILCLLVTITGCTAIPQTQALTAAPVVTEPPIIVTQAPTVAPTLSFTPVVYNDATAGYQVSYPQGWALAVDGAIGSRGSQSLLLSPGSSAETIAENGTRIALVVYKWDPKNDLGAYLAQRKLAWEASGFKIVEEKAVTLFENHPAVLLNITTPGGGGFITCVTTVGEDYLQASGEGDLLMTEEILSTITIKK